MPQYTQTVPTMQHSKTMQKICPACGGLQCLCRPRFFAGQLLTEEDLNRLENYIIEKNKLHNRYLHGWGVVCGLEVVCNPCHNLVTVKSGYALSPCGEDVIVCNDETVDVCALIQQCRPQDHRFPDCDPPHFSRGEDCQEVVEDWVLAICYDEKPSRGITALRGGSGAACCSRCSCGGSAACGCGCHDHTGHNGTSAYRPPQRQTPPQCEPTLTCEGYVYRVYKAPPKQRGGDNNPGALVTRFLACIKPLLPQLQQLLAGVTTTTRPEQLHALCCTLKETLRDFLATQGLYDCLLADKLATVVCPSPAAFPKPEEYIPVWTNAIQQLGLLAAEFFRHCLCSALLPPRPEPVEDDCVPLATITVRRADCHIVQVCNWRPRKFVTTFPNLGYWFSWLPFARLLHDLIEGVCCDPLQLKTVVVPTPGTPQPPQSPPGAMPGTAPGMSEAPNLGGIAVPKPGQTLSTLFLQSLGRVNKARAIDAQMLALGVLGAVDTAGGPMSQLEFDHPLEFLLLNQVAAPLLENILPDEVSRLLDAMTSGGTRTISDAVLGQTQEMATLRGLVAELQTTVQAQQAMINELRQRLG
jgi:hypothetical protein